MICFPNAKINLGLRVLHKRADGYHDLETVLYPIPFFDVMEVFPSDRFKIKVWGMEIAERENLVTITWKMLRKRFGISPVVVHLLKNIPAGSGLGGGSADAAFFLMEMNTLFNLGLQNDELTELAAEIGSDCPFFIMNQPSLVMGRGEIIKPLNKLLEGFYMLLVLPNISLSTKEAFNRIRLDSRSTTAGDCLALPVESWKDKMENDFEKVVFNLHPSMGAIKTKLYATGAAYASLTGSGSALYGLFRDKPQMQLLPGEFSYRLLRL